MIGVYIVGEDDVTRHVIYRILSYCGAGRFTVLMELPARGGEIKNKIPNFNQLAMKFPVILLTDLDADNCRSVTLCRTAETRRSKSLYGNAV